MPTYEAKCENGHTFDYRRSMSERDDVPDCPACGAPAKRVFMGQTPVVAWFPDATTGYHVKRKRPPDSE